MNSMEEEATQLESEVLRKILRQPKESAHQERTGKMKTATQSAPTALFPCTRTSSFTEMGWKVPREVRWDQGAHGFPLSPWGTGRSSWSGGDRRLVIGGLLGSDLPHGTSLTSALLSVA